jgi:hypothetical protein
MKVAILGGLISPKETTMFDQLFTRQAAVVRYQSLPFAAERQLYLRHLVDEGRSRKTVRNIAQLLVLRPREAVPFVSELLAGLCTCEAPVDQDPMAVHPFIPGGGFAPQLVQGGDSAVS